MQLQDIKPSILSLPLEEVMAIHREVRKQRWITKQVKKVTKAKTVTKSKQEISQSEDKIKQLLMLLGADV
ncbi:hypothetical protein LCGC14_0395360 [marine sediment metagenome]|uniref:Uncharacterized protein n=1 Tax=marine sediment metagenome TaxID=412755 RepID=A0A0F9VKD5_9ZZZZ